MYELTVEDSFDAAHCLRGYEGACERLHGHTYRVQVVLRVARLDEIGISLDFREVKTRLGEVLGELDHQYLNDLPAFAAQNPSAENVARHVYDAMSDKFEGRVFKVTVWETPTSAASYFKDSGE